MALFGFGPFYTGTNPKVTQNGWYPKKGVLRIWVHFGVGRQEGPFLGYPQNGPFGPFGPPFGPPMAYKKGPFDVGFGSYDPLLDPYGIQKGAF